MNVVPLETGTSSKATIRVSVGELGMTNPSISAGAGNVPSGANQNPEAMDHLFYFIIEPLPNHSIHQGWVAPAIYFNEDQVFVPPDGSYDVAWQWAVLDPWFGLATDDYEAILTSSLFNAQIENYNYETYLNSPLEPGLMVPDPIPDNPNGYWWPGFKNQAGRWRWYKEGAIVGSGPYGDGLVTSIDDWEILENIGFVQMGSDYLPYGYSYAIGEQYCGTIWNVKNSGSMPDDDENGYWRAFQGACFEPSQTGVYNGLVNVGPSNNPTNQIAIINTRSKNSGNPWDIHNFDDPSCITPYYNYPGSLSNFNVSDFSDNNVIVKIGMALSSVSLASGSPLQTDQINGSELILNLIGGAQPIGQSMPTVEMNSLITEDIN